jgi:hypothetical protein
MLWLLPQLLLVPQLLAQMPLEPCLSLQCCRWLLQHQQPALLLPQAAAWPLQHYPALLLLLLVLVQQLQLPLPASPLLLQGIQLLTPACQQ